jgi:hypothetical protein
VNWASTRRLPPPCTRLGAGGINDAANSHNESGTHFTTTSSTKEHHPTSTTHPQMRHGLSRTSVRLAAIGGNAGPGLRICVLQFDQDVGGARDEGGAVVADEPMGPCRQSGGDRARYRHESTGAFGGDAGPGPLSCLHHDQPGGESGDEPIAGQESVPLRQLPRWYFGDEQTFARDQVE